MKNLLVIASAAKQSLRSVRLLRRYAPRNDTHLPIALLIGLWILITLTSCESVPHELQVVKSIPIQHHGRIKPLDSFARQTLKFVMGSESWGKKPAIAVLLDLLSAQDKISALQWIRIDYFELKEVLGFKENEHFFSLDDILPSQQKILSLVRSAKEKRSRDERPSKLEQKAEELYTKINTVQGLVTGESIAVLPAPFTEAWGSPYAVDTELSPQFRKLVEFSQGKDIPAFEKTSKEWVEKVCALSKKISRGKIALEVFYVRFKPFECAAAFYFLAFLLLSIFKRQRPLYVLGLLSVSAALFLHSFGIASRVFILSRPPVSNMYESMVFMNWALMTFALVFSLIRRNASALVVGSSLSGLVMLYANLLPIDSNLEVLVPVLRSNYWLTIHVMTVVSSYGAFGLAMGLGHRHLFSVVFKKFSKAAEEESAHLLYKVIQLGTLLIGTGTVLGGVWANESWGRFWGWDPKETWALITFLGYLIVIHLRFLKKLDNFMLAVSSIVGFQLVLMTWYGVNFVLGRGLHSYGAGSGGMVWVIYYLIFETAFLGWVFLKARSFLKNS